MLTFYGSAIDRQCNGVSRRDVLKIGTSGVLGLSLADLLRADAARAATGGSAKAKSLLLIYMGGGQTHHDTFDPKPEAPQEIRGKYGVIPTKLAGIKFTDQMPRMAQCNDLFTLVRSQVRVTGGRPVALPLLLWARPTPAGERVWLWLRPGLALEDLDGKAGLIAVTCIAKQVRIAGASDRYAAFLRVDVTRRDPLTDLVRSPLALLIPSLRHNPEADVPVSPAVPPVGLDLADVEDPPTPEPRGGRR